MPARKTKKQQQQDEDADEQQIESIDTFDTQHDLEQHAAAGDQPHDPPIGDEYDFPDDRQTPAKPTKVKASTTKRPAASKKPTKAAQPVVIEDEPSTADEDEPEVMPKPSRRANQAATAPVNSAAIKPRSLGSQMNAMEAENDNAADDSFLSHNVNNPASGGDDGESDYHPTEAKRALTSTSKKAPLTTPTRSTTKRPAPIKTSAAAKQRSSIKRSFGDFDLGGDDTAEDIFDHGMHYDAGAGSTLSLGDDDGDFAALMAKMMQAKKAKKQKTQQQFQAVTQKAIKEYDRIVVECVQQLQQHNAQAMHRRQQELQAQTHMLKEFYQSIQKSFAKSSQDLNLILQQMTSVVNKTLKLTQQQHEETESQDAERYKPLLNSVHKQLKQVSTNVQKVLESTLKQPDRTPFEMLPMFAL